MSAQDPTQRLHLPGRALALVVAGGRNDDVPAERSRLAQSHFGGKFRSVDFALSNCLNSGMRRIVVVSPHRSHSLQRHLKRSWSFLKGDTTEFLELLLPQPQPTGGAEPQADSADLLARQLELLGRSNAEFVLVLTGDRIYKMNYASMLADHVAKGRACTVACIEAAPVGSGTASDGALGASARLTVDTRGRIVACAPAGDSQPADPLPMTGQPLQTLLSTGIYIFNRQHLLAELTRSAASGASGALGPDFERDIVPRAVRSGQASAHAFAHSCISAGAGLAPYWRDVSTVDAYWEANIDLTTSRPQFDLYDPNWPMRAQQAELPPVKFLHNQGERRGMALESLISGGSIISGSVLQSVLFAAVRVHSYAQVERSVLLPAVQVGRHARLRRVVVDRGCSIPDGLVIGEDAAADAARFFRTERGVTLVTADMLARLPGAAAAPMAPMAPTAPTTPTAAPTARAPRAAQADLKP